ncbi:MAG: hypothetical protein AB1545_11920, partial [Thermodesulfobacteriota bacterium]
ATPIGQKCPQRSTAMLPGAQTHPCTENFSLDLATTFILQKAQETSYFVTAPYAVPGIIWPCYLFTTAWSLFVKAAPFLPGVNSATMLFY